MKLVPRHIPDHFLNALPEGIQFVRRHQQDFLVAESLFCPRGHSLMAEVVRIHGEPSIRIRLEVGRNQGLAFIDAFWGGHTKLYAFIPDLAEPAPVVRAFCPVCGADMVVEAPCGHAGCACRRAIVFHLPGGANRIHVCARLGCAGHRMEIARLSRRVLDQVSAINYEGPGVDDMFMEI